MQLQLQCPKDAENVMLNTPDVAYLRHWSKLYSAKAHLAGEIEHAQSICDLWNGYGISTKLVRYDVLQNFPISASLSLHSENGSIEYQASLKEPSLPEDPSSGPENGLPAFHGYSANGNVHAELVYANFGTLEDFKLLASRGISVEGKIVICKYAKVFRGLKVRAAEMYGAVGLLVYNDPQEDGEYTADNGYLHYPHGPARHPFSIQRGSVDFFSVSVGDPTTPGYPSLPGEDTIREDPHHAIPSIPSLPISFADAAPLLQALDDQGLSPFDIGGEAGDWKGCIPGVKYHTGPSKLKVSLVNEVTYKYHPIYNVIGTVPGTSEELIVLGNHHDSWCCGAVDPVSGSAAMNEVARGLGSLVEGGWKPQRTIIMASWDDEEYGLVGSTEWAEDNANLLSEHCVAYEATNGGTILGAVGSPLLAQVLREVSGIIPSPISSDRTVYDDWLSDFQRTHPDSTTPTLDLMGTGSDYTVFLDHLGIPSLDLLFNRQGKGVYPYHSNYDSYYWLEKFGDVGFRKHLAMSQLWGVLAVRLATADVVLFKASEYATILKELTCEVKSSSGEVVDFSEMEKAIKKFEVAAAKLDAESKILQEQINENKQPDETAKKQLLDLNRKYMMIERRALSSSGLPGRPWFKHLLFAPALWKGYDGIAFPGLMEAIEESDFDEAGRWIQRIAQTVQGMAEL